MHVETSADTAAVRRGEELDAAALAKYLNAALKINTPVEIAQFPSGHSNLVYLIRAGDREYVLRRPPLGPVPPKAHDMTREYRVLKAVHPHFPEAPRVFALCEDPSIVGANFFLMERRYGVVLRDAPPAEWASIPDYPRLVSEAFIDCLVRLHAVDISSPELGALGKPEGFVERQVRGWAERWHRAKTAELPEMDRVIQWLRERLPPPLAPTLVHNDFKLDNVMLRATADRVEAVLDWEMTTLGDPLADLGLTLCYWTNPSTSEALTTQPGWYTRDHFVARYAERTGRDMTHLAYHEVLGIFKLAVILQQIYYRFHRGQTNDERFRNFDARVRNLVARAAQMVSA
ncbi:MAG: phosphotransferase family protein [Bryobacteraceae bacterium]|jgi:aminoglycoside phosphotransferase (APT) family kinase protein